MAPLQLKLPPPGVLVPNNAVDPLPYYYRPLVGSVFAARLQHRAAPARRALPAAARDRLRLGAAHADAGVGVRRALRARPRARAAGPARHGSGGSASRPRELVQANARSMPFADGFFDVVVAFSIFEHLRAHELELTLAEMRARARARRAPPRRLPAVHKLMNAAFATIGFSGIEEHHFSDIADVVAAASPWFAVERRAALPSADGRAAARLGAVHDGALRPAPSVGRWTRRFHAFEKEVEDWHWWYRVRRDILDQQLARAAARSGAGAHPRRRLRHRRRVADAGAPRPRRRARSLAGLVRHRHRSPVRPSRGRVGLGAAAVCRRQLRRRLRPRHPRAPRRRRAPPRASSTACASRAATSSPMSPPSAAVGLQRRILAPQPPLRKAPSFRRCWRAPVSISKNRATSTRSCSCRRWQRGWCSAPRRS